MESHSGKSKNEGKLIATRVQPGLLKQIDDWRRAQSDLPSRPEALRRLAIKGLVKR
jgi:hypothetical protein